MYFFANQSNLLNVNSVKTSRIAYLTLNDFLEAV